MRNSTRALSVAGGTAALIMMAAAPGFAHDCFNPQKDAHAPTGGVNYTLVGFDQNGPILVQTGPGTGIGGFVAIAPGVFGNPVTLYTHSLGMAPEHNPKMLADPDAAEVGGPGSSKAEHACDGKGIDYISACFGE
jgi:hypothetical protein